MARTRAILGIIAAYAITCTPLTAQLNPGEAKIITLRDGAAKPAKPSTAEDIVVAEVVNETYTPETPTRNNEPIFHGNDFYDTYIVNHLELGTRITQFELDDTDVDLGTIKSIDDVQNSSPSKLFATYMINPFWGVELSLDEVEAETRTVRRDGGAPKSDGNVTMSGPILSVVGRYPNESAFTPFATIGLAFWKGEFDEEAHWALGYAGPEEYAALGSPSTSNGGRTRHMDVEDHTGIALSGGCIWHFAQHWALEVLIRYMQMETDATFTGRIRGQVENVRSDTFVLDHVAYGVGVRGVF